MPEFAQRLAGARSFLLLLGMVNTAYRKTSLHRDRPKRSLRLASSDRTASVRAYDAPHRLRFPMPSDNADRRPAFRAYPFFTMSRQPLHEAAELKLFYVGRFLPLAVWWSQTGSNRRPPACKAGALPTELWPLQMTGTGGWGSQLCRPEVEPRPAQPEIPISHFDI